jgi:NADPH:quinone reductase-like Zn-dependent oxidoreductase
MRAARFHTHGPPEVIVLEEVPDPRPNPGEALVKVRACALNHLDLWVRRGIARVPVPLPHIPGSDVAGEVVSAVGSDFRQGQRVMVQPGLSCGRCGACLAGRDNHCPTYDVLGYLSDGGYAELVKVPLQNLIPLPDGIPFTIAAAFPLTFLTAWHMLVTKARVSPGEDVLVLAASSGVGQAAVQIARLHGARVFATAGSDEKRKRARALGATEVLDHYQDDLAAAVRALTNRRGVDIVVEHVGQATWDRSIRCLARGGRLVTCGATSGPAGNIDLRALFSRQLTIKGSFMGSKGELWRAAELFFAGRLAPVVDRTFPLAEAASAQKWLEEQRQFGKVVLEV